MREIIVVREILHNQYKRPWHLVKNKTQSPAISTKNKILK